MATPFDLQNFTPYLLAMASEASSQGFQRYYKDRYGMLRTEWRVLFHLGRYGEMTAKDICTRAQLHKTKVSRAVSALEHKRFLKRQEVEADRRHEMLSLSAQGQAAYRDLALAAAEFDTDLMADFSEEERAILRRMLIKLAKL